MTVLFDTNVLIDAAVASRSHHGTAVRLIAAAERDTIDGLVAVGHPHQCVAPRGHGVRGRTAGFTGHGHRGQLDEEAVPGLLLVGLQRLEAPNVVLREPVQNLREGPVLYRSVRQPNPEEWVVEERVHHDTWGEAKGVAERGAKRARL